MATAATQGRKPNVKRFFTESSGWKEKKETVREHVAGPSRGPPTPDGRRAASPDRPSLPLYSPAVHVAGTWRSFRDRQGLRERQTHEPLIDLSQSENSPGLEKIRP
jgi:hypothetical protein